jgi:hypothetical protein
MPADISISKAEQCAADISDAAFAQTGAAARNRQQYMTGLSSLQIVCRLQDILRPFLLVCESKNPRLISIVLGSIQTLLAHNAVSDEGRTQIVQALQQVRSAAGAVRQCLQSTVCWCSKCRGPQCIGLRAQSVTGMGMQTLSDQARVRRGTSSSCVCCAAQGAYVFLCSCGCTEVGSFHIALDCCVWCRLRRILMIP